MLKTIIMDKLYLVKMNILNKGIFIELYIFILIVGKLVYKLLKSKKFKIFNQKKNWLINIFKYFF